MIGNIIGLVILVLIAVFFGWLTWRAWHAKNAIVKWMGVVFGALLTLVFALVSVVIAMGLYQFYAPRGSPVEEIKVQGTPEQIARGQHLAGSLCVECHTTTGELPLSGGLDMAAEAPIPLGHVYPVNLTPAGPLKDWSDGEILRALREGVDRDGNPLLVMSANGVRYLSEEDKYAVIAYLRSQPPIVNEIPSPPDQPNLIVAAMVGAGIVPLRAPLVGNVSAPPKAATAEYGKYIVAYQNCEMCHGKDLNGVATDPFIPHGPDLRVVKGWTLDQFVTTIRTGEDPGGHILSDAMPWKVIARLDDEELGALYEYLRSLPPVQK